jgi:hypothetical protein
MRTIAKAALIATATTAATACGGSERANLDRPPTPILMTAAIHTTYVQVSPRLAGGGPITLIVSNLTSRPQKLTMETDELGATRSGRTASTRLIPPRGTGRLSINARDGRYTVHVSDRAIRAARVRIGPHRPSSQNQLLLP